MKCYKCKKEIDDKAVFCPNCGVDLRKKDEGIICPKCKTKNNIESRFCEKCGAKLDKEVIAWDFDSKIITITFWICALITTYLISCRGFTSIRINPRILSFLLIAFGIFLILFKNKGKIDIHKEIDNIKKIKLSKVQIGVLFLLSGISCFIGWGSTVLSGGYYMNKILLVLLSFTIMMGVIIYKNFSKLSTMWSTIGQIFCLVASIVCFGFSIQQNNYGNELNSSYESQFESLWNNGTANPGNEYLTYSKYFMIAGIIFLVLFVLITIYKKRKN